MSLTTHLEQLGVERAHLVIVGDPASATSADEVVAYLQQTVTID